MAGAMLMLQDLGDWALLSLSLSLFFPKKLPNK